MGEATGSDHGSRMVTGLFNDLRSAERAYVAALDLGYAKSDVNLVMSDQTRDRLLGAQRPTELGHDTAEVGAEKLAEGAELGGPTGGMLATLAPVLAAVGTLVLAPGLVLAGPIAIALTAAGALAVSGGLIGALLDWGIPEKRLREYEQGIREGGILIGVKTKSAGDAQTLEQTWEAAGGERVRD